MLARRGKDLSAQIFEGFSEATRNHPKIFCHRWHGRPNSIQYYDDFFTDVLFQDLFYHGVLYNE